MYFIKCDLIFIPTELKDKRMLNPNESPELKPPKLLPNPLAADRNANKSLITVLKAARKALSTNA